MNGEVCKAEVRIVGRVTMVGFRAYIAKKAQGMALTGWVRNSRERMFFLNGEVTAFFEGDKDKVEAMIELCSKGPMGSGVKSVTKSLSQGKRSFESFEILR